MLYMTNERYESARKIYQSIGVDTEAALDRLKNVYRPNPHGFPGKIRDSEAERPDRRTKEYDRF